MKREYPKQPLIGVGAIIITEGRILLVKRGTEPGKCKWSIPGGLVKLGESVQETATREVKEESNLNVDAYSLIDVVNNLEKDSNGNLLYHFVIIDFFMKLKSGVLAAGSDALMARWVPFDEVEEYNLTSNFRDFFRRNRKRLEQLDSTNC
ncbi:MAG: NUDIX hydrolase [Candidatus Bathyarchaeota archaeon]|nr:MAG: NUDIX hydrolase [Candidatus Bathyarchaeota archaeon]